MRFVGRKNHLELLDEELARVGRSAGRFLAVRGRRQVGKSRLLTEWLERQDRPYLYYQALDKPPEQELASFTAAIGRSDLAALPSLVRGGTTWSTWEAALRALAVAADGSRSDGPIIVVLDELPYIVDNDPSFEATLQAAWDHELQHEAILLIVVGSDLSMMAALAGYGRPLYQRVDRHVVVDPLNVAEVGGLLGLDATEAFDTYLMTGGFPKVVAERAEHGSTRSFLDAAVADEAHPLVFTAQQMLNAEFPPRLAARDVLEAIGAGERAFGRIQTRAGVSERTLASSLTQLSDEKGVVSADDPWCARPIGGRTRYVVADAYLRFWLRFLADRVPDIARGRGDLVADDITSRWQSYAGGAVEPLVREAVERLLPDERFAEARYVGSYWTRDHQVEIDLTGTATSPPSDRVEFVGSIKWRARRYFAADDVAELEALADETPGWEPNSRLVGVSRTGFRKDVELDVALTPDDLIGAWAI